MARRKNLYRGLFKSKSGVWFVRLRNNGRDRLVTTGKTDEDEAKTEYDRIKATARNERTIDQRMDDIVTELHALPDAEQREETRKRLLAKLQTAAQRKVLISEAWEKWLAIPRTTGQATIDGYAAAWKRFRGWLVEHHSVYEHLGQVMATDAVAYSKDLWAENVTVSTYKLHLFLLARVWRELEAEAGLIENVWLPLLKQKMEKQVIAKKQLSLDQLKKIITSAKGEMQWLYQVGLLTSLRLKDVLFLDKTKYDANTGMLSLIPFKVRRKGEPARVTIPVHPGLLPLLEKPKDGGLYFPELAKRYQQERGSVSRMIQSHFEECGIKTQVPLEDGDEQRRKRAGVEFGFHSLRKSFVSLCAKKTPLHVIKSIVGHSMIKQTLDYAQSDELQRTKAIKSLPVINV